MSSAQHPAAGPSTPKRRWGLLAALVLAGTACFAADAYLKSSDTAGFLPESATWRVEAADLPGAWDRWQQLPPYKSLRAHAPRPLQSIPVGVRKRFGIRPTPTRLQLWTGRHVLAGGGDGGWCVSVRPGILLRAASYFGLPGPVASTEDGERFWNDCATGWREGFFLIASSRAYLDHVLENGQAVPRSDLPGDALALSWAGGGPGTAQVRIADNLPLTLALSGQAVNPEPISLNAWPRSAFWMALNGGSMPALLQDGLENVGQIPYVQAMLPTWKPLAAAWWQAYAPLPVPAPGDAPWMLGVFEADLTPDLPVVELVFAGRGEAPAPEMAGPSGQVHRWNDTEGWLLSVPGDSRTWASVAREGTWYLASHEPLIPEVLALEDTATEEAAAALQIQWQPVAQGVLALVRRAARESLLPGYNEDDVERHVAPLLEAFGEWGAFEVQLQASDGDLQGTGYLARGSGTAG